MDTVADVRRIHACGVCASLGQHRNGMVRVYAKRDKRGRVIVAQYAHVPCYLSYHNRFQRNGGLLKWMELPKEERDSVRPLVDLTQAQWRAMERAENEVAS